MEKRGLISLRGVLLRYLVQTVFCCVLALLLWFAALMCVINSGLALPANQAAQACQKAAQDVLPGMTAATFDETQLDSLRRYALFAAPDSSEVLATNMDAGHLQRAMENRQGKTRWHFGYTQYYMTSKLQDGTVCLLQFDYAVPYADPALRGVLPDVQTVHCILGILLLIGAVVWSTHRTGRFLTRETEKLTAAAQAVARKDLDSAVFSGAKVREYESALQALQTMGDALTGSLQKQWAMEQRQREQIIQLSHKLKTPLTSVMGYAQYLSQTPRLSEADREFAQHQILQEAYYMKDIVDRVLTLDSIKNTGIHREVISMEPLLEELCQLDDGISIESSLDTLECDPVLMKSMLLNLVNNGLRESKSVQITASAGGIAISNEAPALTARDVRHLNQGELLSREEIKSSGYGIPLCHEIAKLHGWKLQYALQHHNLTAHIHFAGK